MPHTFCVAPYPNGCDENPNEECHRGESARLVQTVEFAYSMACNVVIIIFMILLAYSVYSQERRGDAYLTVGQRKNRRQTYKTAWQGFRFVLAFTVPHIALYIFMMWNITGRPRGAGFYALFYFHVTMNPLVGVSCHALSIDWDAHCSYKQTLQYLTQTFIPTI